MRHGRSIIIGILVIAGIIFLLWNASIQGFLSKGAGTRWDASLSIREQELRVEIAELISREESTAPASESFRAALNAGADGETTAVRQTGTVGDTARRLFKELILNIVLFVRWLLHSIVAFYITLVLITLVLFRSAVSLVAILTPKKRVF